jgi:Zn-dependent alcohol dehydrogenase
MRFHQNGRDLHHFMLTSTFANTRLCITKPVAKSVRRAPLSPRCSVAP